MNTREIGLSAGMPLDAEGLHDMRQEHARRQAALAEAVEHAVTAGLAAIEEVQRAVSAGLRGAGFEGLPAPATPATGPGARHPDLEEIRRAFREAEGVLERAALDGEPDSVDEFPTAAVPAQAPWLPRQPADPLTASDELMEKARASLKEAFDMLLASQAANAVSRPTLPRRGTE